jgi:hypothetical protein
MNDNTTLTRAEVERKAPTFRVVESGGEVQIQITTSGGEVDILSIPTDSLDRVPEPGPTGPAWVMNDDERKRLDDLLRKDPELVPQILKLSREADACVAQSIARQRDNAQWFEQHSEANYYARLPIQNELTWTNHDHPLPDNCFTLVEKAGPGWGWWFIVNPTDLTISGGTRWEKPKSEH